MQLIFECWFYILKLYRIEYYAKKENIWIAFGERCWLLEHSLATLPRSKPLTFPPYCLTKLTLVVQWLFTHLGNTVHYGLNHSPGVNYSVPGPVTNTTQFCWPSKNFNSEQFSEQNKNNLLSFSNPIKIWSFLLTSRSLWAALTLQRYNKDSSSWPGLFFLPQLELQHSFSW